MHIDSKIKEIDKVICRNIDEYISDRGFLSQNILAQLRNFVEHIALKIFANQQSKIINGDFNDIKAAIAFIKTTAKFRFLAQFHKFLEISVSHYTVDKENSERLMLKYYEFLIRTKNFLMQNFNFNVLSNISKFPINTDSISKEFYDKISQKILQVSLNVTKIDFNERFYIHKVKPFFFNNEIFYEITFSEAKDGISKFDRKIAFTKLEILKNYSVKFSFFHTNIDIFGKVMPILIINEWQVSIRPCEINNFAAIFGKKLKTIKSNKEYREIMQFLTKTGFNFLDIIEFDEKRYIENKNEILKNVKESNIFNILDICRNIINNVSPGTNIIRYLLYCMNNKIIKNQTQEQRYKNLSNLWLKFGCKPFDQMPFTSSLIKHNPKISDLLECIDIDNRNHEFLARFIKNNAEIHRKIYTSITEISEFNEIEKLINSYNSKLHSTHKNRRIESYNNYLYIKGYDDSTYYIIENLKERTLMKVKNYTDSVVSWINSHNYIIDCEEKKEILPKMFENSKVVLIYGSAGTGKSTLINHLSNFWSDKKKLYLTNTHPALENLRRKISASNCEFLTISKFLYKNKFDLEYDLLVIDECSCVNNNDMRNILENAKFNLLILVGDIYQIESIRFGNWFSLSKKIIAKKSVFELTKPYRAKNQQLLDLWKKVRNYDNSILEHIVKYGYSDSLNDSIFKSNNDDEIILCLNYDGLYGINNLNRFLQESNPNKPINLGINTYKVDDPILFNESNKFSPVIYNNLKGRIVKIEVLGEKVQFNIEIDKVINELDAEQCGLKLIGKSVNDKSIIQFFVSQYEDSIDDDGDDQIDNIIPFQIAYAVSIHKAQGLEYNSVKIVITDEIDELITHNIFYTAITRAKEKLKIYWTPETGKKILESFSKKMNRDYSLFLEKHKMK